MMPANNISGTRIRRRYSREFVFFINEFLPFCNLHSAGVFLCVKYYRYYSIYNERMQNNISWNLAGIQLPEFFKIFRKICGLVLPDVL